MANPTPYENDITEAEYIATPKNGCLVLLGPNIPRSSVTSDMNFMTVCHQRWKEGRVLVLSNMFKILGASAICKAVGFGVLAPGTPWIFLKKRGTGALSSFPAKDLFTQEDETKSLPKSCRRHFLARWWCPTISHSVDASHGRKDTYLVRPDFPSRSSWKDDRFTISYRILFDLIH